MLTHRLELAGAAAAVASGAAQETRESMLLEAAAADDEMVRATSALRILLPWLCATPGMVVGV